MGYSEREKRTVDQIIDLSYPTKTTNNMENYNIITENSNMTAQNEKKLYRICLTGGPCAGKSSALLHIKQELDIHNIMTFIVPEASTLLSTNFISYKLFSDYKSVTEFQMGLLKTQLALEGIFTEMAR